MDRKHPSKGRPGLSTLIVAGRPQLFSTVQKGKGPGLLLRNDVMDPGEMPRVRIMPLFFRYSVRWSPFGEVPISFWGPTFRFNHDEMAGVSLSRPYLELLNVVSNRIGIDSSWIRDVRLELQFHDRLSAITASIERVEKRGPCPRS